MKFFYLSILFLSIVFFSSSCIQKKRETHKSINGVTYQDEGHDENRDDEDDDGNDNDKKKG